MTSPPAPATSDAHSLEPAPQVGLVCTGSRAARYASHYATRLGVIELVELVDPTQADPRHIAAIVIDTPELPDPPPWRDLHIPTLITPDLLTPPTLATLPANLDWIPLAPWPLEPGISTARQLVVDQIGPVQTGALLTGLGPPPGQDWEPDEWWASTATEAITGAALVAERLIGAPLTSVRPLARTPVALLVQHTFGEATVLTQTVAATTLTGLPWLSVDLLGARGRLTLHQEFAPGDVGVWVESAEEFRFPAVPVTKPNVQAPDTVHGGWGFLTLLSEVLTQPAASRDTARADTIRLTRLTRLTSELASWAGDREARHGRRDS